MIKWKYFYAGGKDVLSEGEAALLISIMRATGKVHDRDFDDKPSAKLSCEILAEKAKVGDWLRIRVAEQEKNNKKVVLIYHRLQHFPDHNRWSVSVGIHPQVYIFESLYGLAVEINKQLHDDALNHLPDADHPAELVIYDDISTKPGSVDGIAPNEVRNVTRIGELGVLAENDMDIMKFWEPVELKKKVDRPRRDGKADGEIIRGWGRDKADGTALDMEVIRTILRPI